MDGGAEPRSHPARRAGFRRLLFWVAMALAFGLRLAYLLELRQTPFFDHLVLDLASYDRWAVEIAGGGWLGTRVYYQDPLYPYLLALIYTIIGRDFLWIYLIQALAGTGTCAIVYVLGRRYFGVEAGLAAAFCAALYKPLIFYDIQVEKSFLGVLLVALACLALETARKGERACSWAGAGVLLGFAILIRGNYLLLLPFLLAGIAFASRRKRRLRPAILFAAGAGLVLCATLARNYMVGRDWVLTTSQAGQNLYIGNNPGNLTGMYRAPDFVRADPKFEEVDFAREAERRAGRSLKPSEVSSYWTREAIAFALADPRRFILLISQKALLFWNAYEIPDNLDQYFMERYSRVMRLWLPAFGLVAPLGLLGMGLCAREWRRLWPIYLFAAGYFFSVLLFYVFSRYRLPVVPFMILFAAQACVLLVGYARRRAYYTLGAAVAVALGLAALVHAPFVQAYNPSALTNLAAVQLEQGDLDGAGELLGQVIAKRPEYADAHNNLGVLLSRRGDLAGAEERLRAAIRLRPLQASAYVNLGGVLRRRGDRRGAEEAYRRAIELDPRSVQALGGLGQLRRDAGDLAGAMQELKRAGEIDPAAAAVRNDLGITLLGLGRAGEALSEFEAAERLQPDFSEASYNRGIALERLGRPGAAIEAYRRAIGRRPAFAEAHNNLGNLLAERGDVEGAVAAYEEFLRQWKGDAATAEAMRAEIRRIKGHAGGNR